MRHAGVGFPNGAVDNTAVFALPSTSLLMLATEGRYHHDEAVRAGKRVLWRAIPRIGKRPAELGWSPARFVAETINLTDAPTLPITDFVWANELDLNSERGDGEDDWSGLQQRYALIGGWGFSVVQMLKQWSPGTRIHWPAWTPDHDAKNYFDAWAPAASACDVVDFHAYDSLDKIETAYRNYRFMFPGKPLALTEWHCKGDVAEERRVLQWLAETMAADPLFDAAYFFIWRWWDHPGWWSDAWDIEHAPDRLALFRDPPVITAPQPIPEPPMPETADPWEHWTTEQIAAAAQVPPEHVRATWPHVVAQLALAGINRASVQIGVIGTMAHETASSFLPVKEGFYLGEPEPAETHRRGLAYYPYFGRGDVQLTHQGNYATYTAKLAALWGAGAPDLVADPDATLDQDVAAAVIALWFRDTRALPSLSWPAGYSLLDACDAGDDEWIRRLVYGGVDPVGQARIAQIRAALTTSGGQPMPQKVTFNPDEPSVLQDDDWSCAPTALTWAFRALGRHPADNWIEQDMIAHGFETQAQGLLDHTGAGLVAWIKLTDAQHYGSDGYDANSQCPIGWDDLIPEINPHAPYPTLLGLPNWDLAGEGHWVGVRGYDAARGVILLANPDTGATFGQAELTREQFEARAGSGATLVRVLHPDLVPAPDPAPPPPPPPAPPPPAPDTRAQQAVALIEQAEALMRQAAALLEA